MCECKGSYVCPIHSSSVKNTTIYRKTRGLMTIRQALVVMQNNKIGRRFAINEETSIAAKVLMGAYRKARKMESVYAGSLRLAVDYFAYRHTKKTTPTPSKSGPEHLICKNVDSKYYIRLPAKNRYVNGNGEEQPHCFGAYFDNMYAVNIALDRYETRKKHEKIALDISRYSLTIERKMLKKDDNAIAQSVREADIAIALNAAHKGLVIEANQVVLNRVITEIGMFTVKIRVFKDVIADVRVWVVPAP